MPEPANAVVSLASGTSERERVDRLHHDKVCHFAHVAGGPVYGRAATGESSANHLFIERGLGRLVDRQGQRGEVRTRSPARAPATPWPCTSPTPAADSATRVHGRYVRRLRDAVVGGLGGVIELCVRPFRCGNPACTAVTLAEQVWD